MYGNAKKLLLTSLLLAQDIISNDNEYKINAIDMNKYSIYKISYDIKELYKKRHKFYSSIKTEKLKFIQNESDENHKAYYILDEKNNPQKKIFEFYDKGIKKAQLTINLDAFYKNIKNKP